MGTLAVRTLDEAHRNGLALVRTLALVVPYGRRPGDDPQVALLASRFQPI